MQNSFKHYLVVTSFLPFVQVIGAKVVTNARTPGSRCYGYVTMASAQDAENCIKNLHRTGELFKLSTYRLITFP